MLILFYGLYFVNKNNFTKQNIMIIKKSDIFMKNLEISHNTYYRIIKNRCIS